MARVVTLTDPGQQLNRQAELTDRIQVLHAVRRLLLQTHTEDELCRQAVLLARSHLGFDRVSIWFKHSDTQARGSYGVDESGRLRDERQQITTLTPGRPMERVLAGEIDIVYLQDHEIYDHTGQPIGRGMLAAAAFNDGLSVLGCMNTDNGFLRQPITPDDVNILQIYASMVGHIYVQRREERKLRLRDERLQQIIESSSEVFYRRSLQTGEFEYISPRIKEMLGYEPAEVTSFTLEQRRALLHPDDLAEMERFRDELLTVGPQSQSPLERVFRMRHADGHYIWVHCGYSFAPDDTGCMVAVAGSLRDITERIQAEAALRDSEARFREVVSAAPQLISIVQDGRTVYANPACVTRLGYAEQELLGKEALSYVLPDQRNRASTRLRRAEEGLTNEVVEFTLISKHGLQIHVESISAPIQYNGAPASLVIQQDITARVEAERALRASEAQFRELVTHAPQAMLIVQDGRYVYGNPASLALLHCTEEQLIGLPALSIIAPEYHERLRERMATADQGGSNGIMVMQVIGFDGQRIWTESTSVPVQFQCRPAALVISQDITARRAAEEALRRSEEKFSKAFRVSPDAVIITRLQDGVVIEVNDGFCQTTGYTADEVLGRSTRDAGIDIWVNPADRQRMVELLTAHGTVTQFESQFRHKNGTIRIGLLSARVLEIHGEPCILSITRDITQLREAEQAQRRLQSELERAQRVESLGRLAGGVAHDFNNMLSIILGYAEMGAHSLPAGSPLHGFLDEIRRAATRAADFTRQLMAYGQVQLVAPRVLDLAVTVPELLTVLRHTLDEQIELRWKPQSDLWLVRIDPVQLDQILTHVCANARDAIDSAGRITVVAENRSVCGGSPDNPDALPDGDYVVISVADTGRGMDAAALNHLFEPFYTTKPFGERGGLGMAMVYGAVKQNHGAISVVSTPGQGTTVTIMFPRYVHMGG